MAYEEEAADRIRRILIARSGVVEKKMFGGICFMVRGNMCCGLSASALVVRVGPDAYEEALAEPHARPMDFTGRPLTGMVYVDPPGYRTAEALERWIERAIDFVQDLPAKEPSTGKRNQGRSRRMRARKNMS